MLLCKVTSNTQQCIVKYFKFKLSTSLFMSLDFDTAFTFISDNLLAL